MDKPFAFLGNIAVGIGAIFGSLSLPEAAAVFSGVCGGAWFLVQIYVTLRQNRCTRRGCEDRIR